MGSLGLRALETGGVFRRLSVDPTTRRMKPGGVTIDWDTVTALASDTTVDGIVLPAGIKVLFAGQVLCTITTGGKHGPYDPDATDGRQTLGRGRTFLLDETVLESESMSDHPPALEGGRVWKAMVRATTGTASLAAGPTFATLEPVLPEVRYAQ